LAAWIGRVEFRNSFDPTQGFVIVVPVETAYLGSDALSDRGQSRVRHDETQFPQPSPTPALAHQSHPFGGCRHFALRASSNIAIVTRYSHCGHSRELATSENASGLQDNTEGSGVGWRAMDDSDDHYVFAVALRS